MKPETNMVSIHPYFKPHPGKVEAARALLTKFVEKTSKEPKALFYEFTWSGEIIFCREAYVGAEGLLQHIENVTPVLEEFLPLVDVVRCEVHGAAAELEKLKGPLAALNPTYFSYITGVTR